MSDHKPEYFIAEIGLDLVIDGPGVEHLDRLKARVIALLDAELPRQITAPDGLTVKVEAGTVKVGNITGLTFARLSL